MNNEETLRQRIGKITSFSRASASRGEKEAALLIKKSFKDSGLDSSIHSFPAVGNYWLPLGLTSTISAISAIISNKGKHRKIIFALGLINSFLVYDDVSANRRILRRFLPKNKSHNVHAKTEGKDITIVFAAHHDAASSGTIFHPKIPHFINTLSKGKLKESNEGPPVMLPVMVAPILTTLAALSKNKFLHKLAFAVSGLMSAIMLDIALRRTVPGANDNATGVACLLDLAEHFSQNPLKNSNLFFLSTGSEESLLEGMHFFKKEHLHKFDPDKTFFFVFDTVGSPRLCVLAGEGMIKMHDYHQQDIQMVEQIAEENNIDIIKGLKHRNSTDALYPLKAGYPTIMLGSVDEQKLPSNYHWKTDTAERVNYQTVQEAIVLAKKVAEKIDQRGFIRY